MIDSLLSQDASLSSPLEIEDNSITMLVMKVWMMGNMEIFHCCTQYYIALICYYVFVQDVAEPVNPLQPSTGIIFPEFSGFMKHFHSLQCTDNNHQIFFQNCFFCHDH